jgi:hypothetical protein
MISFWISVVPPKIDWTRPSPDRALGTHNRGGGRGLVFLPAKAAASDQRELQRSRGVMGAAIPRHGIVSPRYSSPVRGVAPTNDSEPAATDVPAVDTDVESGELIAAQLPQVLVMHDGSEGSQMGLCSGEPSRGNQDLGPGEDAHHDSMGHVGHSKTTATARPTSAGLAGSGNSDPLRGRCMLPCVASLCSRVAIRRSRVDDYRVAEVAQRGRFDNKRETR